MPPEGSWLTISEAADALGVSVSTLRAWASDGRVPHVTTNGGHRRFNRQVLRTWVAAGPMPTPAPERAPRFVGQPDAGEALAACAARSAELTEAFLAEAGTGIRPRGSADDRQRAAADWVRVIAEGLRTGNLSVARDRALAHGQALDRAGVGADAALAGMVAVERAVDCALSEPPSSLSPDVRDHVVAVMGWLTRCSMDAWARREAA